MGKLARTGMTHNIPPNLNASTLFSKKQTIKITKVNKKKNEMKNKHTNKRDMIWGCHLISAKFNIFNETIVALLFKLEVPVFYSLGPKRMNFSYRRVLPNVSKSR
jgi:hypothetical protein